MDSITTADRAIRLSITARAPIEQAWAAWTDPEHLSRWFPETASGGPHPGTVMQYHWDGLDMDLALEVMEADAPHRLVLRAEPPNLEPQLQTIQLTSTDEGTQISLLHSGFPGPAYDDIFEGTASGWSCTLQFLKRYLEKYFGNRRTSAWYLGLAPTTHATLYAHYNEPELLARWLTAAGALPEVGKRYRLALHDGGFMSGEVLARSEPRELALSWEELEAVVAFRAFTVAPGTKLVGLQFASWSEDEQQLREQTGALANAVSRLVTALGGSSASA